MTTQAMRKLPAASRASAPNNPRPSAPTGSSDASAPLATPAALRWRLLRLALACALPPWLAVALMVGQERPSAGVLGALVLVSLALVPWLLHALARELDLVASEAAAGRRAARLLQVRTRERDRALRERAELTREVQRDALTQLANRSTFMRRLEAALDRCRAAGGVLTLFYLDLDDFKAVNDGNGHAIGDALLSAFATRLAGEVRAGDLAARLSGDEFAVLMEGLGAAEAEPIARKLVHGLSGPYGLGEQVLQVSASIGIASYPVHGASAAELLQAADDAMYGAKAAGKGGFRRSTWHDLGTSDTRPYDGSAGPWARTR